MISYKKAQKAQIYVLFVPFVANFPGLCFD
jgi:hypothetical protein